VQGTDAAEIGVFSDSATGTVIVICAIDNLGKGAAGQARAEREPRAWARRHCRASPERRARMSVTAADGFVASGVHAAIRRDKKDVAVVRSLPAATGAAMWTQNRVQAAPVTVSKQHLALAEPQAVVINSGVANAATGAQGEADARATAEHAAALLGLAPEQVLVLSTGVIGAPLPLDRVTLGVDAAVATLSPEGGDDAAEAILTTDTHAKQAVAHGTGFTVGGMAKGSGMIHPVLATMLAVVTTDYPLEPGEAIDFLRPSVDSSFNSISVDGECSTNDAVVLLSSGAARLERTPASDAAFALALKKVCADLFAADRRRRRGRDARRRDLRYRSRDGGGGEGDCAADCDLPAREDCALRPRRATGAVC